MFNMKEVAAGKTNIGYTMSLNTEGSSPIAKMKNELSALQHGFTKIE